MNRRDFLRNLALISAGPLVMPDFQMDALISTFEKNCPVAKNLIAIDDVCIMGLAKSSRPVLAIFSRDTVPILNLGLNLFGGIYRWVAPAQSPFLFSSLDNLKFRIGEHPHGWQVPEHEYQLAVYGYNEEMVRQLYEWDWTGKFKPAVQVHFPNQEGGGV